MPHEMKAREYKMLLKPDLFSAIPSQADANRFWRHDLAPLIVRTLDPRRGRRSRVDGKFEKPERRRVRFWDTADCLLTLSDLALRLRSPQGGTDDASAELTLKLRMPDYFVVASADMPGKGGKSRTRFEEDIAPLEVEKPGAGDEPVVLPAKRSIRSRFALSTKVTLEEEPAISTAGKLRRYFPTIGKIVDRGMRASLKAQLIGGPLIDEIVFAGPRVVLSAETQGEFALTVWNFKDPGSHAPVVEISFRCPIKHDEMPGSAAERAYKLFIAMQATKWVSETHSSKTALALPSPCGRAP